MRISAQYRAIGQRQSDEITWVWIGSHNDFDKLFGQSGPFAAVVLFCSDRKDAVGALSCENLL